MGVKQKAAIALSKLWPLGSVMGYTIVKLTLSASKR